MRWPPALAAPAADTARQQPARALATLGVLLLALLLGACTALPPRPPAPPSQAYADTAGTALAAIARASLPAAAAPAAAASASASASAAASGFRLLPTGEFAFNARLALAQRAERSLDAQCYHIHRDQAGLAFLRALRQAALRGVRVRLLVDDFNAAEIQDLLADLAATPQAQVRLFNPLPLRAGPPALRLLLSPGPFERHNHRMHNKLLVADNALALFGGRNVADEYFMNHPEANFVDIDMLAAGAVVGELSAVFDRYWNSEAAWPVHAVLDAPDDAAAAQARFDAAVRDAAPRVPDYPRDPLGENGVDEQLAAGRLNLQPAGAQVFADPPEKALAELPIKDPGPAMRGILVAMRGARLEVQIMSPYFIPGEVGMPMMREGARHGVPTLLYTNSLASTDEPLAHYRYAAYRVEMLRLGVQIHEFSPAMVQRSRGYGAFGRSVPRLHAKVTVIDRRRVAIGSVNLDGRSAVGNTEMSVVIDSPALAWRLGWLNSGTPLPPGATPISHPIPGGSRNAAGTPVPGNGRAALMYRLRLQPDGQTIEWLGQDDQGRPTVTTDEPSSSPWLRLKLWLQSLLVSERLL